MTRVLSKFGQNGAAAQAAKRLVIDEGLKGMGLDKAHFSCAVEDVSPYEAAAAAAILESVASCDTDEQRTAAVDAVKQVFQAQDVSLDRILLDGEDERELDEVLEACREVARQVQQAYGERYGWDYMTLRTITKDLEDLGVKKPLLPMGVQRLPALAAHAISKLVESCNSDAQKFEEVAAVERVFKAQNLSLLKIMFDGDDKPRGPAEVLEACRGVLQQVEQAKSGSREAHVAALIEAARADADTLANLSSDDVLKLLVKKSEELRPGAETSWTAIAEALNELGVQRKGGKQWVKRYVREHYESLQSNQTPLTEPEKRRIVVLEEKFRNTRGKWPKIAQRLGNGRTDNQVKNYFYQTGQDRPWSCCDKCGQWRLREKGTVVVEGAYWTCADGGRKCSEPGDDVLPEVVEEAPVEAPADAAVGMPMALGDDDALQQQPPPDVVEQTAPPPLGSEDENTPMTEAPAADAVPESVAAVDGGGSAPLVQQPAAPVAAPPADPAAELNASFAELKLKFSVGNRSDFRDALAAFNAKALTAYDAAPKSMDI